MSRPAVAAVDIGGTKTAAAVVEPDGRLRDRVAAATPARQGPEAVLQVAVAQVEGMGPVAAVGVGSAGVIDPDTGTVAAATDAMRRWAGTELGSSLAAAFGGVPVVVTNDVHAHAVGECRVGAARGWRAALVVAAGTGIGGALVVDGGVHRGARGVAGHLGHVPAPGAGERPCPCGRVGHLEAVAAGPAMCAEYAVRAGRSVADLAELSARADAGDDLAEAVIADGATALGRTVGGVANLLDPDGIVVGGGIAGCGPRWWDRLTEAVDRELLPTLSGVPVAPAVLGADAALVGAGLLAWEAIG